MISYKDVRRAYNKLYIEMRRYIWNFTVVENLADVEIASYETCVDIPRLRYLLTKLYQSAYETMLQDEDLKKSFDNFNELVTENDEVYVKLIQMNEVVPDANL